MDKRIKQFCLRGHDVFLVGRYKKGACRACSRGRKEEKRAYKRAHPERVANWELHRKYGISSTEKQAMSVRQNHSCRICKERKPLVVDHNHATGFIRGLLCNTCNRAVGLFRDSSLYLRSAADYLEQVA